MSFDLRLHFFGLAMFVPEDDRIMHVLFPSTRDHVHSDHGTHAALEPHHMRIVWDRAYEQPGEPQPWRSYKLVDMERRVLDLSGLPSEGGIDPRLPDELARMDRVANPVPRDLVTAVGDERLAGRVTMDAGALTNAVIGARFFLNGGEPVRLTTRTEWTIRGIHTRLPAAAGGHACLPGAVLMGGDSAADVSLPDLYPIGDSIHLMVFNSVARELPPHGKDFLVLEPRRNGEPDHFPVYFNLAPRREHLRHTDSVPQPAEMATVEVEGAVVPLEDLQTTNQFCVQAAGTLE
jgi:hypothetical protein